MFKNAGQKIIKAAKVLCVIGIVLSVILGIVTMCGGATVTTTVKGLKRTSGISGGFAIFAGLIVMVIGSLASWLSCLLLAGFGELITSRQNTERSVHVIEDAMWSVKYSGHVKIRLSGRTADRQKGIGSSQDPLRRVFFVPVCLAERI